jgi:hypothetical protein
MPKIVYLYILCNRDHIFQIHSNRFCIYFIFLLSLEKKYILLLFYIVLLLSINHMVFLITVVENYTIDLNFDTVRICDSISIMSVTVWWGRRGAGSKFLLLYFNTPFSSCFTKLLACKCMPTVVFFHC